MTDLRRFVRDVADFPKPGVLFRDLTPLLADGRAFRSAVAALAAAAGPFDLVAGIEARGFLFASALAHHQGTGLVIIRKSGKLPGNVISHDYTLEYGADRLEIAASCLPARARVLLVDDVLATGGTAEAAVHLLRKAGAEVGQAAFVIGLPLLGGASRLDALGVVPATLIDY